MNFSFEGNELLIARLDIAMHGIPPDKADLFPHIRWSRLGQYHSISTIWDDHLAFDEADILMSELKAARYQYLDEGTGPDNWLVADSSGKAYNDAAEGYGEEVVVQPECDEEDWQALEDLLHVLETRRWRFEVVWVAFAS